MKSGTIRSEFGDGIREIPLEQIETYIEEIQSKQPEVKSIRQEYRLAQSWADFDMDQFPLGENIAFAVERGEIALLNALPNAGKSTLALNAAISLAAGREFKPVVMQAKPRRVLYIDGETRKPRLQRDIRKMSSVLSRDESLNLGNNLFLICEGEIKGDSLSLTLIEHLTVITGVAVSIKPDFIVIDTFSSLCTLFNENDNAEQQRKIWRPLQKFARDVDAAILVLHHVGKRTEDSQSPDRMYRGRGASASGGAARAVWLLTPDSMTPTLSTLSCVKAKGEPPADVRVEIDNSQRWLKTFVTETQRVVSPIERVIRVINREMKTGEIVAALTPELSKRKVEETISKALQLNKIKFVRRGVYAPTSAASAKVYSAEAAEAAEM